VGDAGHVIPQDLIDAGAAARVGGKALALARMARAGIAVPPFVAVATDAYLAYLEATGLRTRILFELERKDVADMRWEELWDAALRIRSLFLTTPLPRSWARPWRSRSPRASPAWLRWCVHRRPGRTPPARPSPACTNRT
jgi:hypothetical protein